MLANIEDNKDFPAKNFFVVPVGVKNVVNVSFLISLSYIKELMHTVKDVLNRIFIL